MVISGGCLPVGASMRVGIICWEFGGRVFGSRVLHVSPSHSYTFEGYGIGGLPSLNGLLPCPLRYANGHAVSLGGSHLHVPASVGRLRPVGPRDHAKNRHLEHRRNS